MERFQYKAKNSAGKTLSGKVEARDIHQAALVLREKGMVVIKLAPIMQRVNFKFFSQLTKKVKFADVVNFTRQLSTMINAGLPLTNALALLESQVSPALSPVVTEILHDVEGGKPLGEALEKHPKVFNTVFVSLVRAGEAAGKLDEMLNRLADNLEKEREFRSKTKGAMIYPLIIVIGMLLVAAVMMIFVIPKLTSMFDDFGAELPFATKILVAISDFVSAYWVLGILGIGGAVWLFKAWSATAAGKRVLDRVVFKIPIYGNLKKEVMMAEFCRTLGLLIGAGVSIVEALNIVAEILQNGVYSDSVKETAKRVEKGIPMASIIAGFEHFPPLLSQMLAVGEETGKIDEVLLKLSNYFESESEQLIKGLTTAIEPLIMIVLGVGVGFLVISIILPIYNLTSQL